MIHEGVMSCWKYSFNLLIGISKEDRFAVRVFCVNCNIDVEEENEDEDEDEEATLFVVRRHDYA